MKQKIRKIVVDGKTYLWRFAPGYAKVKGTGESGCHDVFTAWHPANRKAFLRVHFYTLSNPYTGGPFRDEPFNLHTPQWAEKLIRQARHKGWNPSSTTKQFVVEDGVEYFADLFEFDGQPWWRVQKA